MSILYLGIKYSILLCPSHVTSLPCYSKFFSPRWPCRTLSSSSNPQHRTGFREFLNFLIGHGQVLMWWKIWFQNFLPRQIYEILFDYHHYGVRQWQRFTVSPVGDSQGLLLLLFRRYSLHSGFYKGTTLLATYKRFEGPTPHRLTGNMMIVTYSSQTSLLTHLKAMVTS